MHDNGTDSFQTIGNVADVPDGAARAFALGDHMIAIFQVNGEFFALDDACPHAGASLARGIIESETVRCRIHHWSFSLRDGRYRDENSPACNVRTYRVRVVGDQLQVAVD